MGRCIGNLPHMRPFPGDFFLALTPQQKTEKKCLRCFLESNGYGQGNENISTRCSFAASGKCCEIHHEHVHSAETLIGPDILTIDGQDGIAIYLTTRLNARSSSESKIPNSKLKTLRLFFQSRAKSLSWRNTPSEQCGIRLRQRFGPCRYSQKENTITFTSISLRFLVCVYGPIKKNYFLIYATLPGSRRPATPHLSVVDYARVSFQTAGAWIDTERVFILTKGTDCSISSVSGKGLIVNALDLMENRYQISTRHKRI